MINNKKAQNITKPYTIVLIMSVISVLSVIFFMFGSDLAGSPTSEINDESRAYIFSNTGFVIENRTSADSTDIFYSSETGSEGNLKDYALEFQFYREKSSSWRSLFQDLYGLPTMFMKMLNLPVNEAWTFFIVVFNGLVWAVIFYAIYRIIRGLI